MEITEQQFTKMVQAHKSTIYTVCYMFSQDEDEVADLFQEVLIRIWRGLPSFNGNSDVKTWIYRINVASLKLEKVEENSLTDTMQKLLEMKQARAKSFYIMMPLLIVWSAWTGIEMYMNLGTMFTPGSLMESAAQGGFIGLLIGIPVGIFAAIRIYRKMQRTNESLIEQIKDMADND